jgi:hypothetical protein
MGFDAAINTDGAYGPWSTDVIRVGAGTDYCDHRTRQSRSQCPDIVERL